MAYNGVLMRTGHDGGGVLRRGSTAAACVAALALVTGCSFFVSTGPERDADGAVTAEAETDASSIRVGDCIDDPGSKSVSDITVLPCDEPHVFEAFASTDMPDGDYPGGGAATTAASDFCAKEFTAFIGVDFDASVLEMLYFYPVEESWTTADDREILCFVAEQAESPMTGTLEDAGR